MVLEDGRSWGEAALSWQWDDAIAIITGTVRRTYMLRARGMSKTSDTACVALALLLTEAPASSTSHAYAVDGDQAGILHQTLTGLIDRSGLADHFTIGARVITVKATGATLTIESSDGASAYGTRPWLTIVDELGVWPGTANHRRLWSAIVSAVPKVLDGRLVVTTTAGSPVGLGHEVWERASTSGAWLAVRRAGPCPWWPAAEVESARTDLTASEYQRLILCEWSEGDDALSTTEDVEACIRRDRDAVLEPRPGLTYVAALDVGTRRDLTALAVGHTEHRPAGRVVIIDRVLNWRPEQSGGKVDLAEVEESVLRLCRHFHVARLRFDRMQAEQMTSNLTAAGVRTLEYVFTPTNTTLLARGLYGALRDWAVEIPEDAELVSELQSVRMVETGPGTVKMINPPGTHDDLAVAIGMVIADLTQKAETGIGSITDPGRMGRGPISRDLNPTGAHPSAPMADRLRRIAERGPRGINAIVTPGSANDPRRVGQPQPWQRRRAWH